MKKIFLYSLIVLLLAVGNKAVAGTGTYTLLEPLPCIQGTSGCTTDKSGNSVIEKIDVNQYISYVFKLAIALAVFLAVIMIIWGGFEYMVSEAVGSKNEAKERINHAIYGLIAALVSYLILQTIDPRLVQIKTELDSICAPQYKTTGGICDPNALNSLTSTLTGQLQNLSAQQRLQSQSLQNDKKALELKKADLQRRWFNSQPGDPDYITDDEYKKQLEQINADLAKTSVGLGQVVAESGSIEIYTALNRILYDVDDEDGGASAADITRATAAYTAPTVQNRLVDGKFPVNSPNIIQNTYNKKINDLLAIQPQTAEATEAERILGLQRNFFIDQAKQEVELKDKLDFNPNFNPATVAGGGFSSSAAQDQARKVADTKQWLTNKRDEYTKNLADPSKLTTSGLTAETYKVIMQARIDHINEALPKYK